MVKERNMKAIFENLDQHRSLNGAAGHERIEKIRTFAVLAGNYGQADFFIEEKRVVGEIDRFIYVDESRVYDK